MDAIIHNTKQLGGKLTIPSSKSHSVRALFFSLLAKGESQISNLLDSDDTTDALRTIKQLGAKITILKKKPHLNIKISSAGPLFNLKENVYTGDSGITTAFALPIIGLSRSNATTILDCGEQMRKRPLRPLLKALNDLKMEAKDMLKNGSCPISLSGRLDGGTTELDGLNSQYTSSLLIALPCVRLDSKVIVKNLYERPYVKMTLSWLDELKIKYRHIAKKKSDIFLIKGGQSYKTFDKTITGDFSSASCLIAAAVVIAGKVTIDNLNIKDTQADKALIKIIKKMGGKISYKNKQLMINGGGVLCGNKIDCSDFPDLLPALTLLGTQTSGKTRLYNVPQAKIKESDRIGTLAKEFRKLGAKIIKQKDGLTIYKSRLTGTTVNSHGDHRIAMALTVAGMVAEGSTKIKRAECVKKTYPNFYSDLKKIGANIKTVK